jgi:hypothetical protein
MARQAWLPYFEGVDAVMVCKCIIVSVSPTQRLIVRSIPVVVCKSPQHRLNPTAVANATFPALSGFDERLPEDPKVNRLEDSLLLWRTICGSFRLLRPSGLILFLTGCDVLRRKLKRGVQVKDTVPSYGDRPNDPPAVVKCELTFLVVVSMPLSSKCRFQRIIQGDS